MVEQAEADFWHAVEDTEGALNGLVEAMIAETVAIGDRKEADRRPCRLLLRRGRVRVYWECGVHHVGGPMVKMAEEAREGAERHRDRKSRNRR